METAKTISVNIVCAALIAILMIWGNTTYRQWLQYQRGEAALAQGNHIAAIAGYEAALHMYTPFSPLVEKTAGRLWEMGERYEHSGDRVRALIAYRSLRSSFLAARWLFTPGGDWIDRCDERIARLTR